VSADPESKKVFVTGTTARSSMPQPRGVDKLPDSAAPSASTTACAAPWSCPRGLTLLSPDPAKRIAAAQSVFKSMRRARLPSSTARSPRNHKGAKRPSRGPRRDPALQADATEVEKLEAVAVIKAKATRKRWAVDRIGSDVPPNVARAAAARSPRSRATSHVVDGAEAWYGLSLGSVLLLAAMGSPSPSRHGSSNGPWRDGDDRLT